MSETRKTIYYDGACPLCTMEIAHYQKQVGAENLCFREVSAEGAEPGPDLTREQALARFHIRRQDGTLVSGAAAFVAIWDDLPKWRWAARLARLPLVLPLMELGYRAFLPVRPLLAKIIRK
jgi:predicted DCC family thiol-disulfide oxidoreductase YuxK